MADPNGGGPNDEQVAYWNDKAGPTWAAEQRLIDAQIRPLGEVAIERAGLAAGESVLDVGCGCGDTTLELARRVAPGGSVLGVDISAPMLEQARRNAAAANLAATFMQADAQTHHFEPASFDLVFSRFGVMFFADPAAAFANLRRALRPNGRLAFVCWQAINENPWMFLPMGAALQYIAAPPLPAPGAPGPFAFADPQDVRRILETAGFADIALAPLHQKLLIGGGQDVAATADFMLKMGPAAFALREAADPGIVPRVAAAVREAIAPYQTADGVRMDSACWVVTARA
jgi:SAM-dependent methyltransferase